MTPEKKEAIARVISDIRKSKLAEVEIYNYLEVLQTDIADVVAGVKRSFRWTAWK